MNRFMLVRIEHDDEPKVVVELGHAIQAEWSRSDGLSNARSTLKRISSWVRVLRGVGLDEGGWGTGVGIGAEGWKVCGTLG